MADKELKGEDEDVVSQKLGSRNKLKVPLIGICEVSDMMKDHVLEAPSGLNVIYTLESFIHSF